MIVYKITNLDNGKIYVGQTKFTVDKRFKEHAKSESYIGKAIRKYGEEQFDLEVLATCETREEAYELEIAFIEFFDCMAPNGYNLTAGGLHNPNFEEDYGDGWVLVYRKTYRDLLLGVTNPSILRVFGLLMTKQNFERGINTTKKAIADELKISYDSVMVAFKWLKEHGYVKERKVNGQTEFLLNPDVTTCGKNKQAKIDLWKSI